MLVWIATISFLMLASAHFGGAVWFSGWLARQDLRLERGDQTPVCAVLMSIRGNDPFLAESLRSLATQDYPQTTIHLVVDGNFEDVENLVNGWKSTEELRHPIIVEPLKSPLATCGLKCSALLQAMEKVPATAEVIALIDADVVPRSTWLRELVAPFVDEQIGAVTGGQWFEPAWNHKPGSWIRSLWNAGSIVPTSVLAHPWAGSFAIRRSDFESAELQKLWQTTIVDDGPIARAMHQIGSRIAFEPRLISVNREDCGIAYSAQYIGRMLTWSRWYERAFINTVIHAVFLTTAWVLVIISLIWNAMDGARHWVALLAGAIVVGCWMNAAAYDWLRRAIVRLHRDRFSSPPRLSLLRQFWASLHIPITQLFFVAGVVRALTNRTVEWRRVRYRISGPTKVRILDWSDAKSIVPQGHDSV
jgi:Glycosyl transferase family 21